jgi:hypothetical protein
VAGAQQGRLGADASDTLDDHGNSGAEEDADELDTAVPDTFIGYGEDDGDEDAVDDGVDDEAGGGEAAERYDGDPGLGSEGDDADDDDVYKISAELSDDENDLDGGATTVCGDLGGGADERHLLSQLIAETQAADVWGLHGGFWHSAFFGRTPSAFFHYNWFLKMLEDEQAEIHRATSHRAATNPPQESSSAHPSSSSARPDFSGAASRAAAGARGEGVSGAVRSGSGEGREGGGGVGSGEEKVTAARVAVGDRVVVEEEDSVVVEEEVMSIGAAAEVEMIELAWLKALREMSDRRQVCCMALLIE